MPHSTFYPEPRISKFLFASKAMAAVWAVIRIYLGWLWPSSGWGKANDPAWVGPEAGGAVRGFLAGRSSSRRASARACRAGTPG